MFKRPAFLSAVSAFVTGTAFCRMYGVNTSSELSLLLFLLLVPMYKNAFALGEKRTDKPAAVCGVLFMLACVYANIEKILSGTPLGCAYTLICCIVGLYIFFRSGTKRLYERALSVSLCTVRKTDTRKNGRMMLLFLLCILLCRIPYFLYLFPGNVLYDSVMQLLMATGRMSLSNHHPVVHTMLIKLCFDAGLRVFGSQTAGVAVYSIIQCILTSLAFAYVAETMYRANVDKRVIAAVLFYYCVMPYHGDFAFTMLKDVLFGCICAVFSATLWRIAACEDSKVSAYESVMFLIFGVLFCLFRSNAFFAFILLTPVLAAAFWRSKKSVAVLTVAVLAVSALIRGPLYGAAGIMKPDPIEAYSVPLQHIARTVKDGGRITDEQYEALSRIMDVQKISDVYFPTVADPMKDLVRETGDPAYLLEHKGDYLLLWLKIGLQNPVSYLIAQSDETSGYVYPDRSGWMYGTVDFSGQTFGFDIHRIPLMPQAVYNAFTAYINLYRDIHYVGLFWSIGMMCWIMIFTAGLCFMRCKRSLLTVYAPTAAILATLMIATPVNTEFRYAYSLFTVVPMMCVIPFTQSKK